MIAFDLAARELGEVQWDISDLEGEERPRTFWLMPIVDQMECIDGPAQHEGMSAWSSTWS